MVNQVLHAFHVVADLRRKLAFIGKEGYDIFGNNKLFAPRIRWEELKNNAEQLQSTAMSYEQAYNEIRATIVNSDNLELVCTFFSPIFANNSIRHFCGM